MERPLGSNLTADELRRRIAECSDVSESDVAELMAGNDRSLHVLAETALARTHIRRALYACARLAKDQGYADQGTLTAIERLTSVGDAYEPYVETLKGLGMTAAQAQRLDEALEYLQRAVSAAVGYSQRSDPPSRRLIRFVHDAEIGEAVRRISALAMRPSMWTSATSSGQDMVVVCSSLQDEDGPSIVTLERSKLFLEFGFCVRMLSTELGNSQGSNMLENARDSGILFTSVPAGSPANRIAWIARYFTESPCDVAMFEASGADLLAQLIACLRPAPVQVWGNKGFEPQAGSFDIMVQALSVEQELKTRWPGISKFYGAAVALGDQIDKAEPFARSDLGLPESAILLGTFGRVDKCRSEPYLTAMAAILKAAPSTHLLIAGPDSGSHVAEILARFGSEGVAGRVHYLGRRQSDAPRLVKTIDVYCDTYPWPGGQSLQDAMWAGRAIVAMRKPSDENLDPHGTGVSAVADVLLDGVAELADAGDSESYVRIALDMIADKERRDSCGGRVRQKAVEQCSMRKATKRVADDIFARIATLAPRAAHG
jgi:hypothetical protein